MHFSVQCTFPLHLSTVLINDIIVTLSLTFLSVNLMAALGSLSAIARQRPAFMSIVVQAFESLHGECHNNNITFLEVNNIISCK